LAPLSVDDTHESSSTAEVRLIEEAGKKFHPDVAAAYIDVLKTEEAKAV
jgi:hypothetical protein